MYIFTYFLQVGWLRCRSAKFCSTSRQSGIFSSSFRNSLLFLPKFHLKMLVECFRTCNAFSAMSGHFPSQPTSPFWAISLTPPPWIMNSRTSGGTWTSWRRPTTWSPSLRPTSSSGILMRTLVNEVFWLDATYKHYFVRPSVAPLHPYSVRKVHVTLACLAPIAQQIIFLGKIYIYCRTEWKS